ncbi:uncharacterized protein LOC118450897 [Vespa mandarinia]|uniref:uncharacterized protein LOC118450291 n=1 Tax=Vespa mandarinia TaxID=7446 RepID=UPI00161781DD|nr:uncharacterized protein LOC118450291 [Vespa mandarinia]XP_035742777.1 uncharacterized protein LOC118450897 [Vespa mandarinia]
MDRERLFSFIDEDWRSLQIASTSLSPIAQARMITAATMQLTLKACAIAVPKKCTKRQRRPAYWWTKEIADFRKKCLRLRRLAQRAKRHVLDATPLAAEYQAAKKALNRTINASQRRSRKELCLDLDQYQWGLWYQIVTRKLGTNTQGIPQDTRRLENIIHTLFPSHPKRKIRTAAPSTPKGHNLQRRNGLRPLLPCGTRKLQDQTAFQGNKGKGPADAASSYRPTLMLDTAGKLLEKLPRPRLHAALRALGDLAARQYGFRFGISTTQAVQEVVTTAKMTERWNHLTHTLCLLATLDVRNIFNSVSWDLAMEALEHNFNVPVFLLRILGDYLNERFLEYSIGDGSRSLELTSGAAQGFILGPDIWSIFYDGILRMAVHEGAFLVGYADYHAVVIIVRDTEGAQLLLNQVMRRVISCTEDHGLFLAGQKTEIVLITKKRNNTLRSYILGDTAFQTKSAVKYLGVLLDNKLSYGEYILRAAVKAAKVVASLGTLMANVNGPRPGRRRLLMRVAQALMLYGAEVWAEVLRKEKYRKRIAAVQRRGALGIACSYCTASEPAVLVLGSNPDRSTSLGETIHQSAKVCSGKGEGIKARQVCQHRDMAKQMGTGASGQMDDPTHQSARQLAKQGCGGVDFYRTQFLAGHGLFCSYLANMKKIANGNCPYCDSNVDDDHHTFFKCARWSVERLAMEQDIEKTPPDNTVEKILPDQE